MAALPVRKVEYPMRCGCRPRRAARFVMSSNAYECIITYMHAYTCIYAHICIHAPVLVDFPKLHPSLQNHMLMDTRPCSLNTTKFGFRSFSRLFLLIRTSSSIFYLRAVIIFSHGTGTCMHSTNSTIPWTQFFANFSRANSYINAMPSIKAIMLYTNRLATSYTSQIYVAIQHCPQTWFLTEVVNSTF